MRNIKRNDTNELIKQKETDRLENPMDRGAWWAAVHGVAEGWTQLSDFTYYFPQRTTLELFLILSEPLYSIF